MAKEAGDDDFCYMGGVGTAAAHTHHSEEVKFFLSFGKGNERKAWEEEEEEEEEGSSKQKKENGKILSLEELRLIGLY